MSIFGSIMSKIFGTEAKAAEPAPQASAPSAIPSGSTAPKPSPGTSAPGASPAAASAPSSTASASHAAASAAPQATATSGKVMQSVDIEAVLTEKAKHNPQKLDWKHSIVDLMKLLDLDSGLSARKDLAKELGYTGSTDDSAAMNIWLHRQVMKKLGENGGKVPAELAA